MTSRVFLDTNILVYSVDADEPEKRKTALRILRGEDSRFRDSTWVVSTQVLQEFYVTAVRKLHRPLTGEIAEAAVQRLARLTVIAIDTDLVVDAIAMSRAHSLSLWDSLIVRAALRGGCDVLLTEDLPDGQVFERTTLQDPFATGDSITRPSD